MSVTIGVGFSRLVNSTAEKPMGHAESFETNSTSSSTTTTQDSARDPALRTNVFSCLFHSARHVPTVTPFISHAHCPRVSRATPLLYYNILAFDWSPAPQKKNINIKQSKWTVRHLVLSLDFSMLVWDFVKLKSSGPLFGRNRRYPGHQSLSFPDDSIASQKGKPSALGVRKLQSIPTKQPAILVSTFAPRLSFTCCDMLQTQLLQHPTALRASFLTLPSPHRAGILCNWIQVPRRPWNVPNLSPLLEPSKIQVLSYKLEIQNWRRISFIPLFGPWSFKCRHKSDKENQLPLHLTVFFKRSYHRHISTSSNMLYSSQVRGSDVTGHPCQCWMLVASVPQLLLPPEASPTLAAPPFAAA